MNSLDQFSLLVTWLCGWPAPPLPAIAGRVVMAPRVTDDDPLAQRWEADHPAEAAELMARRRAANQPMKGNHETQP